MQLLYPKAPMAASTPMGCDDGWLFVLAEAMTYPPVSAIGAPKNRDHLKRKILYLILSLTVAVAAFLVSERWPIDSSPTGIQVPSGAISAEFRSLPGQRGNDVLPVL